MAASVVDRTGDRYGRLTVVARATNAGPGNCRWADRITQNNNRRSSVRK